MHPIDERNTYMVASAVPEVRAAVAAGDIPAVVGATIAQMDRDEQRRVMSLGVKGATEAAEAFDKLALVVDAEYRKDMAAINKRADARIRRMEKKYEAEQAAMRKAEDEAYATAKS